MCFVIYIFTGCNFKLTIKVAYAYKESGIINLVKTLIWFAVGLMIAVGIGTLYGLLAYINPIIYLGFLLLAGVVFALTFVFNFNFCPECKDIVVNMEEASLNKNNRNEIRMMDKKDIIKGVYLNRESVEIVQGIQN